MNRTAVRNAWGQVSGQPSDECDQSLANIRRPISLPPDKKSSGPAPVRRRPEPVGRRPPATVAAPPWPSVVPTSEARRQLDHLQRCLSISAWKDRVTRLMTATIWPGPERFDKQPHDPRNLL